MSTTTSNNTNMELLEELRDDFLMCNICFEEYRDPKQLPCLHTFCRQCLGKYIVGKVVETGAEWFPCPFCRKPIQPIQGGEVKFWADSFPANFLLTQLSSKLKEKTAERGLNPDNLTASLESEARTKCSTHPQNDLVGYCTRHRSAVCEDCCSHKHSDCIRNHVRARDTRLMAQERRSECQESLGVLQVKLEGVKDRLATRQTDFITRKQQLLDQTEAAVASVRAKFDLVFSHQKQELASKLDELCGKETTRLTAAQQQAKELTRSAHLVSEKLASLEEAALSVRDLGWLDKAQAELRKHEQMADKLRKDCGATDIQFQPNSGMDKWMKGFTLGTLTVEVKSQGGGARPRVQRYTSDPSSSVASFLDTDHHMSLPAQRMSPDVFEGAPRTGSNKPRALSPPGAAASSLSSSPSTAEGPASGEWDSTRENRRRSDGTFSSSRRTPTMPDFGSVLIEESRRSRSTPRRPRPASEGASLSQPRRRPVLLETTIDGSSERGRSSDRNVKHTERASVPSRARPDTQGGSRTERGPPTNNNSDQQASFEDETASIDSDVTFVDPPSGTVTNSSDRDQGNADNDPASQSGRRIVCVRHFLANHRSDVKNQPGLVGISAVCKDRVAVSDRWNKVVKLVDISGRVMDVLAIPGDAEPWDLALRRPGVLAVTYPKEQKIRLVDVMDGWSRLYYRSHFTTRDGYASLATYDGATLVASVCPPFGSPKVHLIDFMGTVLRALDCCAVAYPRCVDMCGSGQICVSDWTHHNVKIFTEDGDSIQHTYSGVPGVADTQLKAPMGLAWNGRNHVFIVDGKTNKVHAICSQSGTCTAIFSLPQASGSELKLVTFVDASPELCRSERALVVTTTSGSVQVYDLSSHF